MSKHDPETRMRHMLDAAREAIGFAEGRAREDLDSDRMLLLALVRLVEVIGEAATRVPPEERRRYPRVPWPEIIGLRNRLIHGYDEINHDLLWNIIRDDLPPLAEGLESMLGIGDDTDSREKES